MATDGWNNAQPPNAYHLDPLLSSDGSSRPKLAAVAGSRSFAESESQSSAYHGVASTEHSKPRPHPKKWGFSLKNWGWEIATWVLGTAALVVIVALLITYRNERFDSWHSDIQITTIIAALSQLSQSALLVSLAACLGQLKWTWLRDERSAGDLQLFDEASRGPYGSLQLLGLGLLPSRATRRRSFGFPKLAVLGALAIILMLAFSTFAQQAVAVVLRQDVVKGAHPSLPRAETYAQLGGSTLFGQGATAEADGSMSDGVNAGFLSRVISPSDVTSTCGSERCEWEPYWTLAVCPTAEDVTSRMTSIDPGIVDGVPIRGPAYNNSTYISLSITSSGHYRQYVSSAASNLTIEERGILSDSLLFWYTPCAPGSYTGNLRNMEYWRAYRATMHLCLQRLNSTFYNSSMHTDVLESKIDVPWRLEPIVNNTAGMICADSPNGTHCIPEMYAVGHSFKLLDVLTGNASLVPGGDDSFDPIRIRTFATDIIGVNPTACTNNEEQGFGSFERRIQNIAISMSNTLRLSPNATQIFGTAMTTAQFIQVTPAWLAYPAALWLMSTIFLAGTIYHSKSSGAPLWKSSSLALLTSRDSNNDLRSEQEVVQAFKHTGMQLRDNGYGWQLVQHKDTPIR